MLSNLLSMEWSWPVYQAVSVICIVVSVISAIALIVSVMMQSSNSSGVSAFNGQSETFYGKNKGNTLENKLKKFTVACVVVMAVFMIIFCFVQFNIDIR